MLRSMGFGLLILLAATGCEHSAPTPAAADDVPLEGSVDPAVGQFTLRNLELPGNDGRTARVALVGRNLQVDADNSIVSIDVAIHNLSERSLFPQLVVWLDDFRPSGVQPRNADLLPPVFGAGPLPDAGPWGYRYDEALGDDEELEPQELSEFRSWSFYVPDLTPFRFAARIEYSPLGGGARLAGAIFHDADLDGERDADESLFGEGHVFADGPDGSSSVLAVGADGHYGMALRDAGLYTLRYVGPPTFGFAPLIPTTPNPLQVLILSGSDGRPVDFLDADFGLAAGEAYPRPVEFSPLPPGEIESDPFQLLQLTQRQQLLICSLGFGGCGPGHPVRLIQSGPFEFTAAGTPIANLVLAHDDLDELCDAWFEVRRPFDLLPMLARYQIEHGRTEVVLLRVHLPDGSVEELRFLTPDPNAP